MTMSRNVFSSKENHNEITQLVSQTFDIKLSRVQHKIAQKLGYKSIQAHTATLQGSGLIDIVEFPQCHIHRSDFDKLDAGFTALSRLANDVLIEKVICPFPLSLIYQGTILTEPELLLIPLSKIVDKNTGGRREEKSQCSSEFYLDSVELIVSESLTQGEMITVASFQQCCNPEWFIDDLELLRREMPLSNGIDFISLAEHLLMSGNLAQFNFIAQQFELIKELGIQQLVIARYIQELNSTLLNSPSATIDDGLIDADLLFNGCTSPIKPCYTEQDRYSKIELLQAPNIPIEDLPMHSHAGSSTLLSDYLFLDVFGWGDCSDLGDTLLSELLDEVLKKQTPISKAPSGLITHLNFAFELLCAAFMSGKLSDDQKYLVEVDLVGIFTSYGHLIDSSSSFFTRGVMCRDLDFDLDGDRLSLPQTLACRLLEDFLNDSDNVLADWKLKLSASNFLKSCLVLSAHGTSVRQLSELAQKLKVQL